MTEMSELWDKDFKAAIEKNTSPNHYKNAYNRCKNRKPQQRNER